MNDLGEQIFWMLEAYDNPVDRPMTREEFIELIMQLFIQQQEELLEKIEKRMCEYEKELLSELDEGDYLVIKKGEFESLK